jgi:hypothetical protein
LTRHEKEALLAHLLRLPELFELALGQLTVQHFDDVERQLQLVWGCAVDLRKNLGPAFPGAPEEAYNLIGVRASAFAESFPMDVPSVTLESLLDAKGLLNWMFQGLKAEELNAAYGRDLLVRFLRERTVVAPLREYLREVGTNQPSNLADVLADLQQREADLRRLAGGAGASLEAGWSAYKQRREQHLGRDLVGLRTGLKRLDEHTLGLRGLTLLGAGPNVGKTALALQLGLNACRDPGNDAAFLFLSLDMDRDEILDRIVCCEAGLDWSTYKLGSHGLRGRPTGPWRTPEDQLRLDEADGRLQGGLLRRVQVAGRRELGDRFAAADVLALLRDLKARAGAARALVAVDYLQLLPLPEKGRLDDLEADRHRVRLVQDVLDGTRTAQRPDGDAVVVITETRKPPGGKRSAWGGQLADLMPSFQNLSLSSIQKSPRRPWSAEEGMRGCAA